MPARFAILKPYGVVYSQVEGEITLPEVFQVRAAVAADPDFNPSFARMIDWRTGSVTQFSIADFRLMANSTLFQADSRCAIIVPTDLQFGRAQIYGGFVESLGQNVQVFRAIEEACEWLGVPVEALPVSESDD